MRTMIHLSLSPWCPVLSLAHSRCPINVERQIQEEADDRGPKDRDGASSGEKVLLSPLIPSCSWEAMRTQESPHGAWPGSVFGMSLAKEQVCFPPA